jgi:hypothetical protein
MASLSSTRGSSSVPVSPKASVSLVPLVFPSSPILFVVECRYTALPRFIWFFLQELRSNLTIPIDDKPGLTFLGPMGDADPTEMINLEIGQIPSKNASLNLADWDGCFRSWTGHANGWTNWYRRVSAKNRGSWKKYKINQCITLSLSDMSRNESLLIVASYFWSDAINALLFCHGLMSPTSIFPLRIPSSVIVILNFPIV